METMKNRLNIEPYPRIEEHFDSARKYNNILQSNVDNEISFVLNHTNYVLKGLENDSVRFIFKELKDNVYWKILWNLVMQPYLDKDVEDDYKRLYIILRKNLVRDVVEIHFMVKLEKWEFAKSYEVAVEGFYSSVELYRYVNNKSPLCIYVEDFTNHLLSRMNDYEPLTETEI